MCSDRQGTKEDLSEITDLYFDEDGLIPAIIQEASSGEVLMMAYMNRESLEKTLETGTTWFYSRRRKRLWNKGESSGNQQIVKGIRYDCDGDTLLLQVEQIGVACHTGEKSCFYRELVESDRGSGQQQVLRILEGIIKERRENPKEGSYTNYLFDNGLDKILKKVGEEASEVIIASKNEHSADLIGEISDLIYHMMVLMQEKQITLDDVSEELMYRHQGR
ncbi:bifunctional phosphoribosyl-AMP cyclohydrolase/phosphoribosyl-ATP diphosphatase HisIE [Tindallia californiensis]|uniref:Histidine biosynthesis bifunctional protein HisIE n=1 Tax=Tindallia californiensis TaxID=159292 RepID=A0A1H3MMM1_9FIRM|nr:bifunctional phosphoribosyl-AMP cyclohydrolase/phosphoribosyl-ATP diphosphatase HisIE [Tindallia californiensis]SDY77329.1 phosphoribosyl-ATP pyrophosphatase /phosphoribosyl-AMP cyclohydrolase [Tindallia californiensis]